jgi:hypothetical protein
MNPTFKGRTTKEADDYARSLLNAMCDQTKAIERRRLVNFPKCWGKEVQDWFTEGYLVQPKSEL